MYCLSQSSTSILPPIGLIAYLVEHCTGIAEVNHWFQVRIVLVNSKCGSQKFKIFKPI